MPGDFEIKGLPEFERALDKIQKALPDETEKAGRDIGHDWISAAKGRAGGKASEAAATLVVSDIEGGSKISASHIGFFGYEFGGRARPETMMFPPYKGRTGYFLFPTARAQSGRFNDQWENAVDTATKSWNHKE